MRQTPSERTRKLADRVIVLFLLIVTCWLVYAITNQDADARPAERADCSPACVERVQARERAKVHARHRRHKLRVTKPYVGILVAIAYCESNGDWSIDTGNGYYGGLQFSLRSWAGVGGHGNPAHHSRLEQMYRAVLLQHVQGWGAWPRCRRAAGV